MQVSQLGDRAFLAQTLKEQFLNKISDFVQLYRLQESALFTQLGSLMPDFTPFALAPPRQSIFNFNPIHEAQNVAFQIFFQPRNPDRLIDQDSE